MSASRIISELDHAARIASLECRLAKIPCLLESVRLESVCCARGRKADCVIDSNRRSAFQLIGLTVQLDELRLFQLMHPKSLILSLIGVLFVAFSVSAGTSVLEGVVKDASGHPIKGADVRIEAKSFSKTFKTDARGHYVTDVLAVGSYKVTLVINGQVKASIRDAKTQVDKPTQLNFDLSGKRASADKVQAHPVYGKDFMNVRPSTHP